MDVQEIRGKADIGILTVRLDECEAVLSRFQPSDPVTGGKNWYSYARVDTADGAQAGVAITRCIEQGQGTAQAIARNMIEDLDPKWLLVVGIAGGKPDDEYSLGDVVLASRLHDFSVSAALQGKANEYEDMGAPMHRDVERLLTLPELSRLLTGWNVEQSIGLSKPTVKIPKAIKSDRYYGSDSWREKVKKSLLRNFPTGRPAREPKHWIAPTASGNVLVKDADLFEQWLKSARATADVEMELGGVYLAARHGGNEDCRILAIRGLSDIVGYKRDGDWTQYACHSAAAFVNALIRSGILKASGTEKVPKTPDGTRVSTFLSKLPTTSGDLVVNEHVTLEMSAVEQMSWARLYHFDDGHVKAVRLFGADDDLIPSARLRLRYCHRYIHAQPDLRQAGKTAVKHMERKFREEGIPFFDGPNTRLIQWRASPRSGPRSGLEEKVLELDLGPVGWFDYEGLNGVFREKLGALANASVYDYYVGLTKILDAQDISESRLSNIVDTATTLVTKDGFVAYAVRGSRVTLPGTLTSSVAENINRYYDDADPVDPTVLVNSSDRQADDRTIADNTYRPSQVPHPLAAVRRGIAEELSPELLPYSTHPLPKLAGISFDLLSAHPDLLFIVPLPLHSAEILEICRRRPGKDWTEGRLCFMPADLDDTETKEILCDSRWLPGGHASVVRSLQLIQALREQQRGDFNAVFAVLQRS